MYKRQFPGLSTLAPNSSALNPEGAETGSREYLIPASTAGCGSNKRIFLRMTCHIGSGLGRASGEIVFGKVTTQAVHIPLDVTGQS